MRRVVEFEDIKTEFKHINTFEGCYITCKKDIISFYASDKSHCYLFNKELKIDNRKGAETIANECYRIFKNIQRNLRLNVRGTIKEKRGVIK